MWLSALLLACNPADTPQEEEPGRQLTATQDESSPDVMNQLRGTATGGAEHPGGPLYEAHCAACHSAAVSRAPHRSFLEMMSSDSLEMTLREGVMQQQAQALTNEERNLIVEYLVGSRPKAPDIEPVRCEGDALAFDFARPPFAYGWGVDRENTRFVPAEVAKLEASQVPSLELKWAFAYPNASRIRSQPSFAGGTLMVGSQDGTVYSLDAETGCLRWTFKAGAEVRTGLTVSPWDAGIEPKEPPAAYFADLVAWVYRIDAVSGEFAWKVKVDDHPNATVTGQPVLHGDRLYVTVSSLEVVPAADPAYPCCSFRGSLVAMDARTGEILWKSHTISESPTQVGVNSKGTPILAPSGAPSWNSPTLDVDRKRLYAGTGENYSSPAQGSSDAIIAFDMEEGDIAWIRQATAGDAWNVACMPIIEDQANCPAENGPDVDFGSPPILVRHSDREVLVAGQKSGDVYGLSPDDGRVLWHTKLGRGGNQGGVHFGMAAEQNTIFVPMADYDDDMLPIEEARPGLYALDALTGERLWASPADNVCGDRKDCDPGISAAITAIPGVVFAGHMDGRLRAYDSATGKVIWSFDTDREFDTLSGAPGRGGSFGGGTGPMVVDGTLYANSGYGLYFHMPGNVLLAFSAGNR